MSLEVGCVEVGQREVEEALVRVVRTHTQFVHEHRDEVGRERDDYCLKHSLAVSRCKIKILFTDRELC